MTSKGQVTVPVEVRHQLGLVAGSRVDFVPDAQSYRIEVRRRPLASLFGALPRPSSPVTLEDMEAGIARGAAATMGQ